MNVKREWDVSSEETKRKCVEEIMARVEQLQGQTPGMITAEEIIDIVLQNLAPDIHNRVLQQVSKLVQSKTEDLQTDIDLLLKS